MSQIITRYADALRRMDRPAFANKINAIRSDILIAKAEAGPHGDQCEFTQRIVSQMEAEIANHEWDAEEVYKNFL